MNDAEKFTELALKQMGIDNRKGILLEDSIINPKKSIYQEPTTQEILFSNNKNNILNLSKLTEMSSFDVSHLINSMKSKINPRILKGALLDIENKSNPLIMLAPQIHKGAVINGIKQQQNIIVDPIIQSWNLQGVEYVNAARLHRDLFRNNRDLVKGYILIGKLNRDLRNEYFKKKLLTTSQTRPALSIIFSYMITHILKKKSIIHGDKPLDEAILLYGLQKWYVYQALNTDGKISKDELKVTFANTLRLDTKTRDSSPEDIEVIEDLWNEIDESATGIINNKHGLKINSIFDLKNFFVFYYALAVTLKEPLSDGTHSYSLLFLTKLNHPVDLNTNVIKSYGKEIYMFTEKGDTLIPVILNIGENTNIFNSRELKNILKNEKHVEKLTINVINKIKEAY